MSAARRRELLISQLSQQLEDLERARVSLRYSMDKCRKIGEKEEYGLEDQESFEALTARFARLTDILTQKALKSLFGILQEEVKTRIDAANFCEKLGIVDNADVLLDIRELRNQIAHEYVNENLNTLFMDVLRYCPSLELVVDRLRQYIFENKLIPGRQTAG